MGSTYTLMMVLIIIGSILFFGGLIGFLVRKKAAEEKRRIFSILSIALLIFGFLILLVPSIYIATMNVNENKLGTLYSDSLEGAVLENNYKKAEELLKKGEDPNKPYMGYDSNDAPIIHAVSNDNIDMVKLLLKYGADIETVSKSGSTPVIIAASNSDNTKMLEFLIKEGADVNVANENGVTAVHMAAEVSNLEAVKILEKAGADVTAVNKHKESALYYACDPAQVLPSLDLIKYLVEEKELDVTYTYLDKKGDLNDLVDILKDNKKDYELEYSEEKDYDKDKVSDTYKEAEKYMKEAIKEAKKAEKKNK